MTDQDFVDRFFVYEHLPPHLQALSKPICELARWYVANTPEDEERTHGLRKLLEAKDCLVRASVPAKIKTTA